MRPGIHQVAGSGATDGQVPVWNSETEEWEPGTPASGGAALTVQDENGNVSTAVTQIDFQGAGVTATAGSGEVVVTIPGGGSSGNGPDGKPTINTIPTSPNTRDDEFNDGTGYSGPVNGLNARWAKHNLGTSSWLALDDTLAPGCVLFDLPGSIAQDQAIYQAVPAGDFRAACRVASATQGDRQMWGLFVLNTSGTGIALLLDDPSGDTSTRLRSVTSWVQIASLAAVTTQINTRWTNHEPINLGLRKSGGTFYGSAWQGDRVLPGIVAEVSATPTAFTAAYVGFGRLWGAGGGATAAGRVVLDWFRVT